MFIGTKWSSAEAKANFGNHFLCFVKSDFARNLFTKTFYKRLSLCFSHIAHYNVHGFYAAWFSTLSDQLRFLRHTCQFPCYGDPAYTFSDVEREIQREVRRRNYVEIYSIRVAEEQRSAELELSHVSS
jgi:hypothetical protein